jgi:cytoskeletal protein RodZ
LLPQQIHSGKDGTSRGWGVWIALLLLGFAAALATLFITEVPAPPNDSAADQTVQPQAPAATQSADQQASSMPATESTVRPEPTTSNPPKSSASPPVAKSTASTEIITHPAAPPPDVRSEPVRSEPKPEASIPPPAVPQPQHAASVAATTTAPVASADAPPANSAATKIEFEKDTYVATESDAAVRLVVKRTGSTRQAVKFRWALKSNSAQAGSDFADIGPGIEEIPAGARTAHITIPIVSDSVVENTELFLVELSTLDDNTALGEVSHAAVIIVDDD